MELKSPILMVMDIRIFYWVAICIKQNQKLGDMMRAMAFLKGDGKGNFEVGSAKESGIKIDGEVRDIITCQNTERRSYYGVAK